MTYQVKAEGPSVAVERTTISNSPILKLSRTGFKSYQVE